MMTVQQIIPTVAWHELGSLLLSLILASAILLHISELLIFFNLNSLSVFTSYAIFIIQSIRYISFGYYMYIFFIILYQRIRAH